MTPEDHEWATAVMTAINAPGIDLGAWSAVDRDIILTALVHQRQHPSPRFELIVDSSWTANWRLKPAVPWPLGVRLRDYRTASIGQPEDPALTAVNEVLARLD